MVKLLLPAHFKPTHETAGLPGFPAIDKFAPAGTLVALAIAGEVIKLSGHPPTLTAKPGGPYGWSIYLKTAAGVYYLTHFGTRSRQGSIIGEHIPAGAILGTVADYSRATHGVTPSHIHEGFHSGIWTP